MPTIKQEKDFSELMKDQVDEVKISDTALENAMEWIADRFEPDDIFTVPQLERWAISNGYVKE